jgi:hypothetical protein
LPPPSPAPHAHPPPPPPLPPQPTRCLYVSGLPLGMPEEEFRAIFRSSRGVQEARLRKPKGGRSYVRPFFWTPVTTNPCRSLTPLTTALHHPPLAPHARSTTTCRSALVGFVDFDTVDNALRAQKDYDGTRPAGTNSCRLSESWVNCVTPVPHPPHTIPPSRAGLPTLLPGAPRVHCPAACLGRPCPSRPILHERGQTTSGAAQAQVRCAGRQRPARHGQPVAPTVPQAWG